MQGLDYDITGTPRLQQWNVNVQREILSNTSVTLAYVGSRGDHLQQQRDVNPVLARTLADGTVVYGARAGTQTASNPTAQPGVRCLDHRQHVEHVELSLTAGGAQPSFRAGHSIAGVVHAVALPRHIVRQLPLRGRDRGDQSVRPAYDEGPCLIDRTHNLRASVVYQLPFHGNWLADGWQVSTIVTAVSGGPFTPAIGFDQSGLQTAGQRPNLASGRSLEDAVTGGTVNATCGCIMQYFDPTFFVLPAAGTLGSSVGRDSLLGPGCSAWISASARTRVQASAPTSSFVSRCSTCSTA